MTLKLKILRIIRFILEEFDFDNSHFFILIDEEIEDEHLRQERRFLESKNLKV